MLQCRYARSQFSRQNSASPLRPASHLSRRSYNQRRPASTHGRPEYRIQPKDWPADWSQSAGMTPRNFIKKPRAAVGGEDCQVHTGLPRPVSRLESKSQKTDPIVTVTASDAQASISLETPKIEQPVGRNRTINKPRVGSTPKKSASIGSGKRPVHPQWSVATRSRKMVSLCPVVSISPQSVVCRLSAVMETFRSISKRIWRSKTPAG